MPEADNLPDLIRETYEGKICAHADIERLVDNYPCELAYALALVDKDAPAEEAETAVLLPDLLLSKSPQSERCM